MPQDVGIRPCRETRRFDRSTPLEFKGKTDLKKYVFYSLAVTGQPFCHGFARFCNGATPFAYIAAFEIR